VRLRVTIRPGREASLQRRHPWIFSGAIGALEGTPEPGETVAVHLPDGRLAGHGAFSPRSQITVRIWSFAPRETVDEAFFQRRLARCLHARTPLAAIARGEVGALRLVNAESDGLPGLIVDRYGPFVVCQFLSCGAERWRGAIVAALRDLLPGTAIFERSDAAVRGKEGLPPRCGPLHGEPPPPLVEIREGDCRFLVDLHRGHKTGFYLDQRNSRAAVGRIAAGRQVLNAFAYSGGFGVAALCGGAQRVLNLEASAQVLELARHNFNLNGCDPAQAECLQGDAFVQLRRLAAGERRFDLVVLDPPKFAASRAQVPAAARGYKEINRLGFSLLAPGGLLATFSCSGHMQPELFQKIVADAALDAGRQGRIVARPTPPPDHPVALAFPEGHYLKGLICEVD
jgi:23S rRNA (cytosine1962-C5)-methyltransferase